MSSLRVAHRGAPEEAPENTRAAFLAARRHPIDGIELDVRFSRDHGPVVIHDADLARTAGRDDRVADLDRDELLGIDVGSWFGEAFSGVTIPSLGDALETIGPVARAFVEVKDGPDIDPKDAARLARDLRAGADTNALMLVSFHSAVLLRMKDLIPHLRTALLLRQPGGDPVAHLSTSRASLLFLDHEEIDDGVVSFCTVAGYPVVAWTVDDAVEMERVVDCGVEGVVSNRPALFKDA